MKRENKVLELRHRQKAAKLTKIRNATKMRHVIQNEITAELIYLNVRGLNKKDKQDKIRKMAKDSANNNQIITLVET